ncbi:MAG: M15 family metallopeptidase [Clostridiales bacterium]|nr:M15 family metallopeptidase [Clostridiales bacterium]
MKKNLSKSLKYPAVAASAAIVCVLGLFILYDKGVFGNLRFKGIPSLEKVVFEDLVSPEDPVFCSDLMVVSKDHPLPEDFEADVVFYKDTDVLMERHTAEAYGALSAYISEEFDDKLYVSSTYRTYEEQERIYGEEGGEIAALPGMSEHQTGLALDVYVMFFAGAGFTDSPVGRYVNSDCGDYGFIIRYPMGKEDITGFGYEPWHIRYVGFPHAKIMGQYGLTLEEYVELFETGEWYSCDGYLISRREKDDLKVPAQYSDNDMIISPDNEGYIFVTIEIDGVK